MEKKWQNLDIKALEATLKTDLAEGISIRDARVRLEKEKRLDGGERVSLFVPKRSSQLKAALSFFATPAVIALVVMSLLAASFGEVLMGILVLSVALVGAILGGIVCARAQKKLDSMRDYASPMVKVRRGGNRFFTDGRNAVVGDLLILSRGDLLPCDARIVHSDSLTVKELIYTKNGIRNRVVRKNHSVLYDDDNAVDAPDAENMLYAGSAILEGEAIAVVVATGSRTYLAGHVECGALAGREEEYEGVKAFKPTLHKICFICFSALIILALLSLVTLRQSSFIANFLMLLASLAMISLELVNVGAKNIFATSIERMARIGKVGKKKRDHSAAVRNVKAIDTLTGVTDLVLLGKVALSDGAYHVAETYTSSGVIKNLTPNTKIGNRILTCAHTYVKALRESGVENEFVLNGISDAISDHLKTSGFDLSGASLIIKSLYYANDPKGENGYACAETTTSEYRVALTFDESILSFCTLARSKNGADVEPLPENDKRLASFMTNVAQEGGRCLYVVSESGERAVLEGVIALVENHPAELPVAKPQLDAMGISTTVMLLDEDEEAERLISSPELAYLFDGKVAYASELARKEIDICETVGQYCAYVGFSAKEYASLVLAMRKGGASVAAYGLDNDYLDVMTRADIAISCDILRYSSDKYKESVYERLAPEGRDSNIRCSQQTRLASKVMIHRTHAGGGGLASIARSLLYARSAYVSLSQSILLFSMLMSSLLPVVAMSVFTGTYLLSAAQTVSLAVVGALLSMLVFADSEPKLEIINKKMPFTTYPADILSYKLPGMIARASAAVVASIVIAVLGATGVFGETPSFEMPVFTSLLLTVFAELFIINMDYSRRGEGRRRCWLRVLSAYAVLLAISALITQDAFVEEVFVNGIGGFEFLIVPGYCLIYAIAVLIARMIEKKRKKA
ncbi:MAG: hypothetical protein J6L83_02530 [Clostridia bacterium]|nr:hypothetical protein [Clostridia bacterium]